jgi:ATP-GRASP peptide maturase of grasp-with-spasm system
MILVFSKSFDQSTNEVMRWLHHLGRRDVVRVNTDLDGELTAATLLEDGFFIDVGEHRIASNEVESVWFRRGHLSLSSLYDEIDVAGHRALSAAIQSGFEHDRCALRDYLQYSLRSTKRVLGNPFNSVPNKLIVLKQAQSIGLRIPNFVASTSSRALSSSLGDATALITKPITDCIYLRDFEDTRLGYFSYTEEYDGSDLPERVVPSLVQERIEKQLELRIFFLDGEIYTAAIFSQSDSSTKVDFRKYNFSKPNRIVPYALPAEVEQQVRALFELMDLNTGSMDLILDQDGQYVFLEVNPVGQYDWISRACNYGIDKRIAQWLAGH